MLNKEKVAISTLKIEAIYEVKISKLNPFDMHAVQKLMIQKLKLLMLIQADFSKF